MDIDIFAKKIDAKINLPRPTNEQHLSSRRALLRVSEDFGKALIYLTCGIASAFLLKAACEWAGFYLFMLQGKFFLIGILMCLIVPFIDILILKNQYRRIFQRETYGSARWADLAHLRAKKLVTANDKSPLPEAIPIGTFGRKHWLTLPIKMMAKHVLVLGPHGSGKTISFFINVIRAWSHVGSALVLDISKNQGEISRLSAHYYKNVLRFDMVNPECSDRLSFRACKRNPTLCWEVACFMVGLNPNDKSVQGPNKIWTEAAASLIKCLLLHLNDIMADPTPGDIFSYIAAHPYDHEAKVDYLKEAMLASTNPQVHDAWAMFERIDFKVRSSVYFSMSTPLEPFKDPAVQKIMKMPTKAEAARGCRVINFDDLRTPGTVIYCVVKEGQASRLEAVLGTFFGMAISSLRNSADKPSTCHVLVSLDENAQIPQREFVETLSTARGRKMAFMCGYQNISQMDAQFGVNYARAVRQAFLTRIFLPGLTDESADYAVKLLGKTTTFQSSSNDAVGRVLDSERLTEVGVDLMNATELREMLEFHQAIAVVDTAYPARIGFPPTAEAIDPRETFPTRYDMSFPLTDDAIELYRRAMMTPVEKLINDVQPALLGDEPPVQRGSFVEEMTRPIPSVPQPASPGFTVPQTYNPHMQIPYAPYQPTAPASVPITPPPPAPPPASTQSTGQAPEEAIEYTDEIVVDGQVVSSTASADNALSKLMQEQARNTHEAAVSDDETHLALLRALEHDNEHSVVEDFPL